VKARRSFRVKPLRDGDPFLWKERHFSGRLPVLEGGVAWGCVVAVISVFLGVVGITLFAGILIKISEREYPAEVINLSLRMFVTGTILGLAPVVGLRAAGSVTKERQQQTLLSLLTIPESRNRILVAKWLAPLMGVRWWLLALAIAIVLAVFTGGVHPFGAIAACCYLVGFVPFANSLGLWLSLRCTSSLRAVTIFFAVMAILFIGPPIFGTLFRASITLISGDSATGMLSEQFLDNVNPLVGLWRSLVNWSDFGMDVAPMGNGRPTTNRPDAAWAPLISTLVIGMLYTAGAAIFGGLAAMRFQRETV
jgi:ABC-type transport system involved in multi-copper enzyme maturation permease subunit